MSSESTLVFRADNVHVADCGAPPAIVNGDANLYHGYFENEHGEQWVLVIDRTTKVGILRGGDSGWDKEYDINSSRPDIVLSGAEQEWLRACWYAATGAID